MRPSLRFFSMLAGFLVANSAAAQPAADQRQDAASVSLRLTIAVPRIAQVREVVPTTVTVLPDGRREVAFSVVVSANCRWGLTVRPAAFQRASSVPPIEVRDYRGEWVALAPGDGAVRVEADHAPCQAQGVPVVLRMLNGDHVTALARLRFEVAPLE